MVTVCDCDAGCASCAPAREALESETQARLAAEHHRRDALASLGWVRTQWGATRVADGYRVVCADAMALQMVASVPPPAAYVARCTCGAGHDISDALPTGRATPSDCARPHAIWLRVAAGEVRLCSEYAGDRDAPFGVAPAVHRSRPVRQWLDACPECLETGRGSCRLPSDDGRLFVARQATKTKHVIAIGETAAIAYRHAAAMLILYRGSAAELSKPLPSPEMLPTTRPCPHFDCHVARRGRTPHLGYDPRCENTEHAVAADAVLAAQLSGPGRGRRWESSVLHSLVRSLGWFTCAQGTPVRSAKGRRDTLVFMSRRHEVGTAAGRPIRQHRVMEDTLAPVDYCAVDHLWAAGRRRALRVGTRPGDFLLVWPELD